MKIQCHVARNQDRSLNVLPLASIQAGKLFLSPQEIEPIFYDYSNMKKAFITLSIFFSAGIALAAEAPDCRQQKIEQSIVEICLIPGPPFQHDVYTLKLDKKLIFAMVDDFAENVSLEHTIPEGPAIEFPLSRQGGKSVKISGGCVPESKDGAEVARLCNFHWGRFQVVKDIRFEFK